MVTDSHDFRDVTIFRKSFTSCESEIA